MKSTILFLFTVVTAFAEPVSLSGIYPHLAFFNDERECGTGAVVPWADRLWVVTYAPHSPKGSSDKLYEITSDLKQIIRPESIGGTPANRMIHDESGQLFIGPHVIDKDRNVRTIPYSEMFGRPTANARHLTDPAGKIYSATMEEGIYEIDVKTLEVTELFADEANKNRPRYAELPGYHGKGMYSGQGLLVYANNGDYSKERLKDPSIPSGALATWDGKSDEFELILRKQFTDVTGPGGIHGSKSPATDPIWAIGWDHRSVILMLLQNNEWSQYRLPKGSHSYDGAHGWNTEWPRIREIGEGENFLMTMHGTFWKFPSTFTANTSAGIRPRSNYLKVIGDFAKWKDKIVFGCDDTAASEFANKRKAKGEIAAPQSQSNLWFVSPEKLDNIGPVIGRGAVWLRDEVKKDVPSDPYLFAGYDLRGTHLSHGSNHEINFSFEVDEKGDGTWEPLTEIKIQPGKSVFHEFPAEQRAEWIRVKLSQDSSNVSTAFLFRNYDERSNDADEMFYGLVAEADPTVTGGVIRARAENKRTLAFASTSPDGKDIGYYELDAELNLKLTDDKPAHIYQKKNTAIPETKKFLTHDAASVVFTDDDGKRWRFPKATGAYDDGGLFGSYRIAREVATERDMFHAYGTFYELPANNAGGFSKVRPIATHNRIIHDFCSYRGLLILSGTSLNSSAHNPHLIRSDDGKTALWAGAVDDLWKFGKPRGKGGPWKDTVVEPGNPSDPYLMTGYDKKSLTLSSDADTEITVELDISGDGNWVPPPQNLSAEGWGNNHPQFPRRPLRLLGQIHSRQRGQSDSPTGLQMNPRNFSEKSVEFIPFRNVFPCIGSRGKWQMSLILRKP